MSKDVNGRKQPNGKSADQRAFCFCLGELVDCIPGVVLDCNNKRTTKCPLLEEKSAAVQKKEPDKKPEHKKKDNRAFCFCLGSQVDCLPGVVLDCNNKRTTQCPLVLDVLSASAENQSKVAEFKKNYKNKKKKTVDAAKPSEPKDRTAEPSKAKNVHKTAESNKAEKQDKTKELKKEANGSRKEERKKDNRAFCFCLGSQVDCLPGIVLDCNNKRTTKCPLVLDVLSVNTQMDNQVDDVRKKYMNEKPASGQKGEKDKKPGKPGKKAKDNRAFCFCLGSQVDCLPGVVLDCNNKRTRQCPLVQEVLSVNKEAQQQIENLREKYKKG